MNAEVEKAKKQSSNNNKKEKQLKDENKDLIDKLAQAET